MAEDDTNIAPTSAKASQLRLLVLSPISDARVSPSPFPIFLESLTGTAPVADLTTFAGYTSHPPLHLKTRYFEANVGIWCDELPPVSNQSPSDVSQPLQEDALPTNKESLPEQQPSIQEPSSLTPEPQATLLEWQGQMLSSAAREVRDVIGGIIILFPVTQQSLPSNTVPDQTTEWFKYVESVTTLRDAIEDESGRDVGSVVILQNMTSSTVSLADPHPSKTQQEAEALREHVEDESLNTHGIIGWDYILWKPATDVIKSIAPENVVQARNEFGEKTGFPRVREVLEGIDWTVTPSHLEVAEENVEDLIGSDPLNFLEDGPPPPPTVSAGVSAHDQRAYLTANQSARAHLRPMRSNSNRSIGLAPDTNSVLTDDNNEFQREMLGMKMAMLDVGQEDSAPSSLAGEFDASDMRARTPAPFASPGSVRNMNLGTGTPRRSRLADTSSVGGDDEDEGGHDGEAFAPDGGEVQVEQLSGIMDRVVALREAAEGMAPEEKEKFARREVNRIMKELG